MSRRHVRGLRIESVLSFTFLRSGLSSPAHPPYSLYFLAVLWTFLFYVLRRRLAVLPRPPYRLSLAPFLLFFFIVVAAARVLSTSENFETFLWVPFSRRLPVFSFPSQRGKLEDGKLNSYSRRHNRPGANERAFSRSFSLFSSMHISSPFC